MKRARSVKFLITFMFGIGIFCAAFSFSALRAEETRQQKISSSSPQSATSPFMGSGRRLFNARFSPKIFSKREWNFLDWVYLVIFSIATFVFLYSVMAMLSDTSRFPEHIACACAVLSGSIALPWYLTLFALPPFLLKLSFRLCLLSGIFSIVFLVNEYIKAKKENKKPDIFLE